MGWMSHAKPHLSPIIVSLALLASTIAAVVYTHRLQSLMSEAVADNVSGLRAAAQLELGLRDMRNALLQYALRGQPGVLDTLEDLDRTFREAMEKADESAVMPDEIRLMKDLRSGYESLAKDIERLESVNGLASRQVRSRQLSELLTEVLIPLCHEFLEFNEQTIVESARTHSQTATRLQWVLVLAGFLVPVAGVLTGYLASRSISRQLDESRRELLRAEQLAAVGRLAAGMAHEIRNPLTSIMMMVQTATSEEPVDFNVIEDEVRRMERTIQSCLDFAKPPVPHREMLDVRDVVHAAARLVEARLRRQQLELVLEQANDSLPVLADRHQLHQVLLNLLLNAIESGGMRRRMGIVSFRQADDIIVRVWDEGPGIPSELLAQVFDPFVSSKPAGTGLGLSITKAIIESHGGQIEARNRPDGGAEFIIRLQRHREHRSGAHFGAHSPGGGRRAEHPTRISAGVPT